MPTPVVFPVERRAIGIAKEVTAGTPVAMTATIPVDKFTPEDKVTGLIDKSWRQAMAMEYAYIQGTYSTTWELGGPVYADTIGYGLLNILGDYTTTAVTPASPNSTLNGSVVAGATSITVVSGTGFAANQWIQVGPDASGGAEVVQVASVATNTLTLMAATPLRFAHATASAVTNTTTGNGKYSHVFSLLNSAANGAQPPTHTIVDVSGVPASTGARVYSSAVFSDITITGNSTALLTWDGKGEGWLSAIAGVTPTVAPSTQPTQAAWNSTIGIGGTVGGAQIFYVEEWVLNVTRQAAPVWTTQGAQNPYIIVRGGLSAGMSLKFNPAPSEAQLLNYLNNTQPQMQIIALGPNSSSIQIDAQVCAFDSVKLDDSKEAFGYDATAKLIANTTNVGFSGQYSPVKITLINGTPTY